jgi:HNH endonuclease
MECFGSRVGSIHFRGVAINGRLAAAMAAMFANGLPAFAPDDPGERQDFLRALALIALTKGMRAEGSGRGRSATGSAEADDEPEPPDPNLAWAPFANTGPPRFGRAELIVVVDYTEPDANGRPQIDWGSPIDLPFKCVEELAKTAAIFKVVVRNGNFVDPEGELNLGRTTRLANRAQRRALRAMYRTCAVPGCNVPFAFTEPHHVKYWRDGGPTDLANLVPLCHRDHENAHAGWTFALGPNRELTITLPDGRVLSTGPPKRSAA